MELRAFYSGNEIVSARTVEEARTIVSMLMIDDQRAYEAGEVNGDGWVELDSEYIILDENDGCVRDAGGVGAGRSVKEALVLLDQPGHLFSQRFYIAPMLPSGAAVRSFDPERGPARR